MNWQILESLDEDRRRAVLAAAVRRRYRDRDTLFHMGDPGDSVHLLAIGHVAIRTVSRLGEVLTLDVLKPGDSFGEQSLLSGEERRTASAEAIGKVETLMLQRDRFEELRRSDPGVADAMMELLAAQVRRLTEQVMDAHVLPADDRVLKQLRRIAAMFRDGDGVGAVVPLTQEEVASLAGTTRPTANRALQPLVDRKLIELRRGRIIVADVDRLPTVG